jgi:hypothetical protein
LILLFVLAGCAGRNPLTIYRPNARTPLEQRSYNTLLVSERMISTAEASNAAGTLPEFMRPIVDGLIDFHNLAKGFADVYVAAIGSGDDQAAAQELVEALGDLDTQILKMFERGGT